MKTNSYIKFTNIIDLIQLYFKSIDLPKVGIRESIFTHTPRLPIVAKLKLNDANVTLNDSAKPTLRERGSTDNRQLQTHRSTRRHRSLDWRWQARLMQCF